MLIEECESTVVFLKCAHQGPDKLVWPSHSRSYVSISRYAGLAGKTQGVSEGSQYPVNGRGSV